MNTLDTHQKTRFVAAAILAGVMLAACSQKPESANEVAAQQLVEATQKAEAAAERAEAAQKALEEAEAEKRAAEEKATADQEQAEAAAKLKAAEAKAAAAEREAAAAKKRAAAAERQAASSSSYTEARPAPKPVCQDCGTITAITAVKIKGKGTGMGAVAGAIAGVAAGNQVGDGKGTDVAKVIGAIGGAYAGNQAEKHIRAETVYDVTVRLDNGSTSTVRVADASSVGVGGRVRVAGDNLEKL